MFCPKCGKETPDGAQFCLHCGFPIGAFLQGGRTDLNPPPAQAPMQTPIQDPVQTPIQAPAEPVSPQIQPEEPAQRAFPGQQPAAEQQTAHKHGNECRRMSAACGILIPRWLRLGRYELCQSV